MLIVCMKCSRVIRSDHGRQATVKKVVCFRCVRVADKDTHEEKDKFLRLLERGAKHGGSN